MYEIVMMMGLIMVMSMYRSIWCL